MEKTKHFEDKLNGTLQDYCDSKKISISEFSKMTGISPFHLYKIKDKRRYNVGRDTMRKIYLATQKEYEKGLLPHEYLEII